MAETGVLIKGSDKDKVCLEVAGSGQRERRAPGEDVVLGMGREGPWLVLMGFTPLACPVAFC